MDKYGQRWIPGRNVPNNYGLHCKPNPSGSITSSSNGLKFNGDGNVYTKPRKGNRNVYWRYDRKDVINRNVNRGLQHGFKLQSASHDRLIWKARLSISQRWLPDKRGSLRQRRRCTKLPSSLEGSNGNLYAFKFRWTWFEAHGNANDSLRIQ